MLEEFKKYCENNRLEAKLAQGGLPKSIWETYSAFANSMGGVILLGVEENLETKELVPRGVPNASKMLDDFWNTVNNDGKVSSNILKDSDVAVLDVDGMDIICINVPRADRHVRPVYLNGHLERSFRRNHTGDYLCKIDEVRFMVRDSVDTSQDSTVLTRVRMDELNASTIESYRRLYAAAHDEHPWNNLGNNEFLRSIGAAGEDEDSVLHPTIAGLLMFGEDWRIEEELPNYFLDYRQQTEPNSRWQNRVISQGGDWTGNVFDFYYRVYNLMKQALKVPFKLEGITRVDDTPAHRALREALANCLTNANFFERRGVVCLWEDDKLSIANPGDFRVDMDVALRGGTSDPRNGNLMRMFSYINVGERAGSGLPKIMEGWKECGYDTPFYTEELGPDRTTLTLPLTPVADVAATGADDELQHPNGEVNLLPDVFASLSKNEKAAVKLVAANGTITASSFADSADISRRTASTVLKRLAGSGVLKWVGNSSTDPKQHYVLGEQS